MKTRKKLLRKVSIVWVMMIIINMFCACGVSKDAADSGDSVKESDALETELSSAISGEDNTGTGSEESSSPKVIPIKMTPVQAQASKFFPLDEPGEYNRDIITDELLDSCALGEVKASDLPYWTGIVSEKRISVNNEGMPGWEMNLPGFKFFSEEEIRLLAESGMNCYRVLYSLSFLSRPGNVQEIDEKELEQLDEMISWCAKYNVHCMISVIGLPGMNGCDWEEENVGSNPVVFYDEEAEELFRAYFRVLSHRYAALPSGLLSFELMAEPAAPVQEDGSVDMDRYCEVLGKIARDIWEENEKRIVIVQDLWNCYFPEELAKQGCCLSAHRHMYPVDDSTLEDYGVTFDASWPMQYFPYHVIGEGGEQGPKICSEEGFSQGTFTVYLFGGDIEAFRIICDGNKAEAVEEEGQNCVKFTVDLSEGTKEISWESSEYGIYVLMIELKQDGKPDIKIPAHNIYNAENENDEWPVIRVNADGSLSNLNDREINIDYMYDEFIRKGHETAQKYGVSFIATEVGTDTVALSVEEYLTYHAAWLEVYRSHKIGWMYNCAHNIIGPMAGIWLNGKMNPIPFENFEQYENTPYYVNTDVWNLLMKYSK